MTHAFAEQDFGNEGKTKILEGDFDWYLQEFFLYAYRGYDACHNDEETHRYATVCVVTSPYTAQYQIDFLYSSPIEEQRSDAFRKRVEFVHHRCAIRLDDLANVFGLYAMSAEARGNFQEAADCFAAILVSPQGERYSHWAKSEYNRILQDHPEVQGSDYSPEAVNRRNEEEGHPFSFDPEVVSLFQESYELGPNEGLASILYEMTGDEKYHSGN